MINPLSAETDDVSQTNALIPRKPEKAWATVTSLIFSSPLSIISCLISFCTLGICLRSSCLSKLILLTSIKIIKNSLIEFTYSIPSKK